MHFRAIAFSSTVVDVYLGNRASISQNPAQIVLSETQVFCEIGSGPAVQAPQFDEASVGTEENLVSSQFIRRFS
jgi:hypothetical protein